MNVKTLFVVNGQVRPLWKFFVSAVLMVISNFAIGLILSAAMGSRRELFTALFWSSLLMLPALLAVTKLLTAVWERKPFGSVGLSFGSRWKLEFAVGLGLGAAMIYLVAGLEHLLGLAGFAWNSVPAERVLLAGAQYFLLLLVAATNEELTFRGYPFQRLVDSVGPWGAVVVSSCLFGLVHLWNPSTSWISTANTMLVGVPLAVAYLRTRALWLPIGMHFTWNFFQGYGLGLPISGIVLPVTAVKAEVQGAQWLTGGSYGPEGGLLASAVIVAATIYLSLSRSIYVSEDMKRLIEGPRSMPEGGSGVPVVPPATAEPASRSGPAWS